jgi:hypothetical protein
MHVRWSSLVLVACAIAETAGCKKEQDSLILVNVRANTTVSDVTSLTLSAEGTSEVFHISGLSASPQPFGLYVPSSVVGIVKVSAVAATGSGTCAGYKGQGTATVDKAGATSDPPTTILMMNADICAPDAGTGGSSATGGTIGSGGASATGGATGQGGTFGTGGAASTGGATGTGGVSGACATTPPPGTPPSLACCQEYLHAPVAGTYTGVWGVAFSPDGQWLVTGGDDFEYQLWSFDGHTVTKQKQPGWSTPGGTGYGYVAFSPDGRYVALSGMGGIGIYDVGTWAPETTLSIGGLAIGVGFTPDGHVVSMDGSTMYLHAIGNAQALASVPFVADPNETSGLSVSPVAVSGAVAIAAAQASSAGPVGALFTYIAPATLNGPALVTPTGYSDYDYIYSTAIAPNGTSVAFGDVDATVWFASYPTGPVSPTTGLVVDPSESQLITGLAYSQDGNSLAVVGFATASSYVGTITIWSLVSRTPIAGYQNQTSEPVSVAFSPAGNALVVGEYDNGKFLLCTN